MEQEQTIPRTHTPFTHRERMHTVRHVGDVKLLPGFDICHNPECRRLYQPKQQRQKFCSTDCRDIVAAEIKRQCNLRYSKRKNTKLAERAEEREIRVMRSRRVVGIMVVDPEYFVAPCMVGLARDEGIDGTIPWAHSWSGADPLPADPLPADPLPADTLPKHEEA
jgi:hypothetical protein